MDLSAVHHTVLLACLVCAGLACWKALRLLARKAAARPLASRAVAPPPRECAEARVPAVGPRCQLAKQAATRGSRCPGALARLPSGAPVAVAEGTADGAGLVSPASSAPCSVADSAESLSRSSSGMSSPSDSDTESNGGRRLSTSSSCSGVSAGGSTCARRFRAAGAVSATCSPAAAVKAMTASSAATCSGPSTSTTTSTSGSGSATSSCSAASSSAPSPRPVLRSSLRRPQAPRAKAAAAGVASPARRKTVTFSAEGDTICSPPTVEALGLLAAGARAVPVLPLSAATMGSPLATTTATDAVPLACSRSRSADLPAGLPSSPAPVAASSTSTSTLALSPAAPSLSLPSASSTSSSRAAGPGRQRVQQALAEARARHAHLGRQPLPAAWPLPPHAPGYQAELLAEAAARQRGLQAQEPQAPGRRERLAGSPNLPLSHLDSGLLSLAYTDGAAAGPSAPESGLGAAEERAQDRGGRRAGGVAAAAALREVLASEPLLLARVVARQQALSSALAVGAAAAQ
ncbi:hypothetical protein HYH02_008204 [Chlamydomonas schloesseri]|uniref:Uncharacterized protein n=1 Tax=Chlamydomonas schloesseri TaxID=2026947 RepID=A0A836B3J3_9CHLO|nr:hypothetical protein HYH02_008204 [Chlamydomonas schloesseri]|eukprot:KAG2446630.1 hypothetical protein HYH02_008204 [Chlamydomonas schloesseri]